RIAVVGAGVVGCLCASLAGKLPGAEVTLIDIDKSRAVVAAALGVRFAPPDAAPGECDLVIPASASQAGAPPRTAARRQRGDRVGAELVWRRTHRGSTRRGVPQPPAEADIEPGRAGGGFAPGALVPCPSHGGGARPVSRSGTGCADRAGR